MRIKDSEKSDILSVLSKNLDQFDAYLFGSRVNDSKKGGDIDLLVLTKEEPSRDICRKIKLDLYDVLGEQKIDLIISSDETDTFVKLAKKTGIKL